MLGGSGQTRKDVESFLGQSVYTIPCGCVPRGLDPHGRIIHDYSYAFDGINSINSCLLENSVHYIAFKERVAALSRVSQYIVVDLEAGYRQLPVSPSDQHTQVYTLGPNEFYIDVCMPFGKANSSKIFCHQVQNWCTAFVRHFSHLVPWQFVLKSYVDDIFGGANSFYQAMILKLQLIATGRITTAVMNQGKCLGPSQVLPILGFLYDAMLRRCTLPRDKQHKYLSKLLLILNARKATSKDIEKLLGYLGFASQIEPFGRPFLSAVDVTIDRHNPRRIITLSSQATIALQIWEIIIRLNRGSTYDFILNQLPCMKPSIFVDASTSQGVGGFFGVYYFRVPNETLTQFYHLFARCNNLNKMEIARNVLPIAFLELLAALLAVSCFSQKCAQRIVYLQCDNENAVRQLQKSRCSAGIGFRILAAVELYKYRFRIKVSARHIPGAANKVADALSRGAVPLRFRQNGIECHPDIPFLIDLMNNPLFAWKDVLLN